MGGWSHLVSLPSNSPSAYTRVRATTFVSVLAAVALVGCGDSSGDSATDSDAASGTVTIGGTAGTTAGTGGNTATGTAGGSSTGGNSGTSGTTAGTSSPTTTDGTTSNTSATGSTGNTSSTTTMGEETETGFMPPDPFCGDGNLDEDLGEECDDGDNIDNNTCSNECTLVPCEEQGGNGNDNVLSYIWIANSSQNTVSKINTETAVEEARYYVEGGSPSRTSVNLDGDVAVSSRDPGGVTKIAAKEEDCVDKNNNGMIDTSTGPNDILPLGTDECVLWQKPIPSPGYSFGPRATAWVAGKPDPVTCEYPEPVLWMGWKDNGNTAHFLKIDGATGDTIDEVTHPWGSSYSPYGGAVDADGNFFATGLNQMPSVKIDFETLQVTDLGNPVGCKYGMTLDLNGFVWNGACFGEGVYYRDPDNMQWTTMPDSGGTRVNGIMADADGNVWGAGSSPCRLVHIDAETKTYVNKNIPLPGCVNPWGVSIDFQGYVWVVDMSANKAFKVDPDTYQVVAEVTGLQNPYTYSDMTGVALKNQIVPQ